MRYRTFGYAMAVTLAGSLIFFTSRNAESQNAPGSFVNLQASTPGVAQTGSLNISSVAKAGLFKGSGAGLTNLAAPNISSGLLNDARLSPRVPLTNRLNTFSAVQRFASNILMTSTLNSIIFPAVSGNPSPMISMFLDGTSNADRMVIAHSPAFTNWGLQYRDSPDKFVFLSSGSPVMTVDLGSQFVGIGSDSPTGKLDVRQSADERALIAASNGSDSTHPISFYNGAVESFGRNGGIFKGIDGTDAYGVIALTDDPGGHAVHGVASNATGFNYGVWGQSSSSTNGYGLYALGNTGASGTKQFRIDHPADPAHKYLIHYSSEGPEPLNIYSGTTRTGQDGYATVILPDYYESINKDARIQLTVEDNSDDFVMVKALGPVQNGRFVLRTNKPMTTVYWEVKAVRNDRFVQAYGAPVEKEKPKGEYGYYQHPELYGFGPDKGYQQGPRGSETIKP